MAKFNVSLTNYETLREIPGVWTNEDYKALLEAMDYGDVSEIPANELKEMCFMAITDLEPAEAAKLVLTYRLGNELNEGQIQNLSHEMEEQPMWEEFPDMTFHEPIFYVNQLLFQAYNGKFPQPKAVRLTLDVTANHADGEELLKTPTEAFLARIIAGGMPENSTLLRLFEDQIRGQQFPDAAAIIWKFTQSGSPDKVVTFQIIGSSFWLEDIKGVEMYETEAHADIEEEEEMEA